MEWNTGFQNENPRKPIAVARNESHTHRKCETRVAFLQNWISTPAVSKNGFMAKKNKSRQFNRYVAACRDVYKQRSIGTSGRRRFLDIPQRAYAYKYVNADFEISQFLTWSWSENFEEQKITKNFKEIWFVSLFVIIFYCLSVLCLVV